MGVNPALFAVPSHMLMAADTLKGKRGKKGRQIERYVSSFEGYLLASGPVPRQTSLVQLVGAGEPWTMEQRRELAAALPAGVTRVDLNMRWAGWSRKSRTGGWGWTVQDHMSMNFRPGAGLAELAMLGPMASYFDLLVTADGDTIANTPDLSDDVAATVTEGLSSQPLELLSFLGGTQLGLSYTRSYSLGGGLRLIDTEAFRLGVGAAARYYRGRGYYTLDTETGDAFSAFNKGLGATLLSPDATLGSVLHPAGYGVGLDFGVRLDLANALFASVAVTDLGRMEWTGEHYKLNNPFEVEGAQSEVGALFDALTNTLDPVELFVESTPERRVVSLPTRLAISGGLQVGNRGVVAIELSAPLKPQWMQEPTSIGIGGRMRFGPMTVIGGPRLEFGEGEGLSLPSAVVVGGGEGRWEMGLATGDIFAIWKPVKTFSLGWSLTYRK
jgi:hypothetical protein